MAFALLHGLGQILGAQEVAFRKGHGAFDHVFELAHVAGPVVGEQHFLRPLLPALDGLPRARGDAFKKMVGQRQNVLLAATQGWQVELDDVQAIVEIFTEPALV